jgi:hypothetical protein
MSFFDHVVEAEFGSSELELSSEETYWNSSAL